MPKKEYLEQGPTPKWNDSLHAVVRFHEFEMIHRTNLLVHAKRVRALALEIGEGCLERGYQVDMSKVARISIHHDDPEIETGDIATPIKRAMSLEEKEQLRKREMDAANRLAAEFTTLPRETYLSDQKERAEKETVESQIVDVADKIDGLCETLHELRCGNEAFWKVLENYRNIFLEDLAKYPIYENLNIKVPGREDVLKMGKVDIKVLDRGKDDEFWEGVYSPNLPAFFKAWMEITANSGLFRSLASSIRLFPGWRDELIGAYSRREGREISDQEIAFRDMI